jgi:X-X-X-Leu-X-X-Gly heptad repeat protein
MSFFCWAAPNVFFFVGLRLHYKKSGAAQLNTGAAQLNTGAAQLNTGAAQLFSYYLLCYFLLFTIYSGCALFVIIVTEEGCAPFSGLFKASK